MESSLLVIFLVNDNHISNVKTLQSIYKQDYPNIYLAVCNDCTNHFQSERLLYNFMENRPDNIKQIYYHENIYPLGEYQTQKQFWDRYHVTYVITLHSGEYFVSPEALTNCVKYLEYDRSVPAIVTSAELWSDDMRKKITQYTAKGDNINEINTLQQSQIVELRDCMLVWRLDVLKNLNIEFDPNRPVSQSICAELLDKGKAPTILSLALCKFSESSICNVTAPPPAATYGNILLQSISLLLKSSNHKELQMKLTNFSVKGNLNIDSLPNKKLELKLYECSRFSNIKHYAAVDMLLIVIALVLIMTPITYRKVSALCLLIAAIAVSIWTALMVIINLYFKKNPQRLVF